ncbi:hypothetical protein AUP40_17535 [Thalassospira xiamenensis]|uniref:Uncharacterized protein n=1 Tax=Thalassospira xiamenensis TaxID=220697 RepID=A0ABR5Y249_9PROT|nr:hypothetical protein AUP40_17535 [Thalassospira xiamenensis]
MNGHVLKDFKFFCHIYLFEISQLPTDHSGKRFRTLAQDGKIPLATKQTATFAPNDFLDDPRSLQINILLIQYLIGRYVIYSKI